MAAEFLSEVGLAEFEGSGARDGRDDDDRGGDSSWEGTGGPGGGGSGDAVEGCTGGTGGEDEDGPGGDDEDDEGGACNVVGGGVGGGNGGGSGTGKSGSTPVGGEDPESPESGWLAGKGIFLGSTELPCSDESFPDEPDSWPVGCALGGGPSAAEVFVFF